MDAHTPTYRDVDVVTTRSFVDAMASSAMGVSIVTTQGVAGQFGLTVSAWSSVSAEPPLVLACINRKSPIVAPLTVNGRFAINVLTEVQAGLARVFAGRSADGRNYDFAAASWHTSPEGDLMLDQSSAAFSCVLDSWHDAGTHRIFIGRVEHVSTMRAEPLLYHNRSFGRFDPLP